MRLFNLRSRPNQLRAELWRAITGPTPDPEVARQLLEIMEKLDKLDKKLGLVECADAGMRAKYIALLEKVAGVP